jgi:copper chaperone CopZ
MKKGLVLLMLLSSLIAFAGEQINVTVKGMVCSFCSQGITKKFKAQPAVKDVNVNLDTHLVTIELKDDQKIEDSLIETLLKDAGYGVETITRK